EILEPHVDRLGAAERAALLGHRTCDLSASPRPARARSQAPGVERAMDLCGDLGRLAPHLDRTVGERALHAGERALVVARLELGELQAVRGRDDHDALVLPDDAAGGELLEAGERDAGVRAVEHPGAIRAR